MEYYLTWSLVLAPFYLLIGYLFAKNIKNKYITTNPAYKYFTTGLIIHAIGAIGLCLIYTLYYEYGDTVEYYRNAEVLIRLFFKNPSVFFSILSGNLTLENFSYCDANTGWLAFYMYRDHQTFTVVRLTTLFVIPGFYNYINTSILVSFITYTGVWKLYLLFSEQYPKLYKEFAWIILFFPSLVFWGAGILKDSFTLSALGWLMYSYYSIFYKKTRINYYVFTGLISIYMLSSIKPYILFAAMFGILVWLMFLVISKIKSPVIRFAVAPTVIFGVSFLGLYVFSIMSEYIGGFYSSVDSLVNMALLIQSDLKMDYYQGNSFDIGLTDSSLKGILSVAHKAIIAGIYRPFIWEVRNSVMFISGLETLLLLCFTFYIFFKTGVKFILKTISENPFLIFAFSFSIIFGFCVGFTTSNFGSLVRYRIPLLPFLFGALLVIRHLYLEKLNAEFFIGTFSTDEDKFVHLKVGKKR